MNFSPSAVTFGKTVIDLTASTRRYNPHPTRARGGFCSHPQTQINLLPVEFEDDEPNTGLDDVTMPNWFMVPFQELTSLYALTGASASSPIDFDSQAPGNAFDGPDPSRVTKPRELLDFVGRDAGDSQHLVAGIDPSFSQKPVLNIHVREKREITVAINPIITVDANGDKHSPTIQLNAQDVKDYFNKVYKDQVNVEIVELKVNPSTEVAWDVGGPVNVEGGTTDPQLTAPDGSTYTESFTANGFFDVYNNRETSLEEDAVISASFDNDAEFNIYLVASPRGYIKQGFSVPYPDGYAMRPHTSPGANGKSFRILQQAVGWAGGPDGVVYVMDICEEIEDRTFEWTATHEVGHQIMGRVGHVKSTWTQFNQDVTGTNKNPDFERGLMNDQFVPNKNSTLIIKWEADQIENYLVNEE